MASAKTLASVVGKKKATASAAVVFHVVTLFPESFDSYIGSSIIGRARREGHIDVRFYNPRDYAEIPVSQKKRARPFVQVDDRPFGGGPGMVMRALPVLKAVAAAKKQCKSRRPLIVFFDAGGEQFSNTTAATYVKKYRHVILICGRYEGIDIRVASILKATRVSIGPYVLTGGELPALVMLDCMARQVPGVLGDFDSLEERRTSAHEIYTRPEVLKYKGISHKVPQVLLSGNHKEIDLWKKGLT